MMAGMPTGMPTAMPTAMPSIAEHLQRLGAVRVSDGEPFTLTSGKSSPVYVDCRRVLGDPTARAAVITAFAELAVRHKPQIIAGGETAGIPLAALLAEKLSLPMVYIRKRPKGFGKNKLIEGGVSLKGKRVLLVEDLSTDGGSKRHFIEAIKADCGEVVAVLVIFSYGLEKDLGTPLEALATWDNFLSPLNRGSGRLSAEQVKKVKHYLIERRKA